MVETIPAPVARHESPLAACTAPNWFVAFVRPRYENRLVGDLRFADVTPIVVREKVLVRELDAKGHTHRRYVERPLFPGYVFCNCSLEDRCRITESLATLTIIDVRQPARLVHELSNILRALALCPTLGTAMIQNGTKVRVTRGPLQGMEGVVLKNQPGRLFLICQVLGAAVEIEVPPDFVEVDD